MVTNSKIFDASPASNLNGTQASVSGTLHETQSCHGSVMT